MRNNYLLDLPPVLGADNQPLTVEQSEQSLRLPWPVEVTIERSGKRAIYTVLCDLNNVDAAALDGHELFKAQSYAAVAGASRRAARNSKLTHLKDSEDDEPQVSGEAAIKSAQMRSAERATFLALLYPPDWEENPVVLASNMPDMPTDAAARRAWFERGGVLAVEVMEAIVMQIDPTGPLAQTKQREAQAREMEGQMTRVLEEKLAEIQNLSLVPAEARAPEAEAEAEAEATEAATTPLVLESVEDVARAHLPAANFSSPSAGVGATESLDAPSSSATAAP